MKIAINTRFLLGDQLEGIGRYTYEVCKRLVSLFPEDDFLFLFDRSYDDRFVFSEGVQPMAVAPPARHPVLWYLWFEWAVASVLKKQQADVFFSPDGYLSLRSNVPTVMTVHDLAFEHYPEQVPIVSRYYYPYFSRRYCRRADHILSVSAYTKKDIIDQYQIPEQRISVCGNGCRDGFRPLEETEKQQARKQYAAGREYFLYVGAVHPRKNVHRLIEAFGRFKKRTSSAVKLLIAGRFAWQTGAVKSSYDASAYQEDIAFLGFVPDEDLPGLMGSALCFVYPSLFEGFGIPLLEAMHAEVPFITSNVSSMPEVAGSAGRLIDPLITDQIAIAMQVVYQEEELRNQMIERGKVQRQQYSWDKTASIVAQSIERVLPSGR
jgi:glycosyltransferase involved in cell wall biosynthesis